MKKYKHRREKMAEKMFCKYCGKEIADNADVCIYCGRSTGKNTHVSAQNYSSGESKTGIGVLLGLILGLIGLVIGLLLYKDGTVERSTFIKGWAIAFVVSIVLAGVIYGIYAAAIAGMVASSY